MSMQGKDLAFREGVFVDINALQQFRKFEEDYLHIRAKENRVLTPDQIKLLPQSPNQEDEKLWEMRRKTIQRFRNYLRQKPGLKILEVGCGNGYFANILANDGHAVSAVDVHLEELLAAAKTFKNAVTWYYLNIMEREVPGGPFDMIVFNASLQYFSHLKDLIKRCDKMLSSGGEIHIMDSPFYKGSEKNEARIRTIAHFKKLGNPEMALYYSQHDETELKEFGVKKLYRPNRLMNTILRIRDTPFPWLMIPKQSNNK